MPLKSDQARRLREQHHPQHRAEQQRVVLARADLVGGGLPDREEHREGGGEDRDQRDRDRQVVEAQGA
jgi:hypothetical protein